jgi:hypothetical protein
VTRTRSTTTRWLGWFIATWLLVFPRLDRIGSHLVGDRGDAFFNYYVLRWDAHVLVHPTLWNDYWAGTIFHGAHLPMAYSETHLGIAPVFALLQAVTGNGVLAMNVMFLASWMIGCEAVYRLSGRVVGPHRAASVVAALGWTFSTIRISQFGHFQLAMGALMPVVIIVLLDVLARPRWWRGVLLGVTWAACTLSASYYGILLALTIIIMVTAHLIRDRRLQLKSRLIALVAAAATAGVLAGPVVLRYLRLQNDPAFRRGYESDFAARWADLRATSAPWLANLPLLDHTSRSSEQYAFVGVIVGALAVAGLWALIRREPAVTPDRRWVLELVGAAGILALLVGLGHNVTVFGAHLPSPYDLFADVVPGFRGMRAVVRLLVLFQLAAALLAAVGFDALPRTVLGDRLRRRARSGPRARWFRTSAPVVALVICVATIGIEAHTDLRWARVPTAGRDGAANEFLADRPEGPVLELPISSPAEGVAWAFAEAPRMVLSTIDWKPRVSGYSGFYPPLYQAQATALNTIPESGASQLADGFGVRFLVLRTAPIVTGDEKLDQLVIDHSVSHMTSERARAVVAALPPDRVVRVDNVSGAVVVELTPSP